MNKALGSIYQNQSILAKSATDLDNQFAVLTRLTISTLNAIIERLSQKELVGVPLLEDVKLITYESVNELFHLFDAFKAQKDFRNQMRDWMMGTPIELVRGPEASEVKVDEAAEIPVSPYPEGATFFGGEGESDGSADERTTEGGVGEVEATPLPGMQAANNAAHESQNAAG